MAEFEKVRYQVNRCLCYQYPGDANDENGSIDRIWILITKATIYLISYFFKFCHKKILILAFIIWASMLSLFKGSESRMSTSNNRPTLNNKQISCQC